MSRLARPHCDASPLGARRAPQHLDAAAALSRCTSTPPRPRAAAPRRRHRRLDRWRAGSDTDTADPRLQGDFLECEASLVLRLGLLSSHPLPCARPTMCQIDQYLVGDVPLPELSPTHQGFNMLSSSRPRSTLAAAWGRRARRRLPWGPHGVWRPPPAMARGSEKWQQLGFGGSSVGDASGPGQPLCSR